MDVLLSPPVLFFALGAIAALTKSDLEVPAPISRFLGLYLLLSIGFHGGVNINRGGVSSEVATVLVTAILAATITPFVVFAVMRRWLAAPDAAAVAAAYGSVSAVTFITAGALLRSVGVEYGGHMVAAMALMEAPAIVVALALLRRADPTSAYAKAESTPKLLRDAFFNGSVLLILGSLTIGLITGDQGWEEISPFADQIFKGMLCLFLLDMGMMAAREAHKAGRASHIVPIAALVFPLLGAGVALLVSYALSFQPGDAVLFVVLCASASYIAVPAAMRLAVPDANPGIYVGMALGITFPFNILIGLPVYLALVRWLWPSF